MLDGGYQGRHLRRPSRASQAVIGAYLFVTVAWTGNFVIDQVLFSDCDAVCQWFEMCAGDNPPQGKGCAKDQTGVQRQFR